MIDEKEDMALYSEYRIIITSNFFIDNGESTASWIAGELVKN